MTVSTNGIVIGVRLMKIVCFGDSLTSCGGEAPAPLGGRFSDILQDRFPGHEVVNRGVGGEGFIEARERLQTDVLDERPDIVLIEYGANDWWRNERRHESWAADLDYCITRIRKAGGRPVVLGVFGPYLDEQGRYVEKQYGFDDRAEAYRRLERETAERHGCPYVPNIQQSIVGRRRCRLDSNHPNEYGNRHVADAIEPVLEKLLQTPAKPVRKPNLETLRDYWREAVALAPDRTAVVDGDRHLTYSEADALVEQLAAGLAEAVPARRPKVAVCLPNCSEFYAIYLACLQAGFYLTPINWHLAGPEIAYIVEDCGAKAFFAHERVADICVAAAEEIDFPKDGRFAIGNVPGFRPLSELTEGQSDAMPTDRAAGNVMNYTSGTTGKPKGVKRALAPKEIEPDLIAQMMSIVWQMFGVSPEDDNVHICGSPLYHTAVLVYSGNSLHVFGFVVFESFGKTGATGHMVMPEPGEKIEGGQQSAIVC